MQVIDRDGGPCHVAHSKPIRSVHASGLSGCVVFGPSGSRWVWSRRSPCARGEADQAHRQAYSGLHGRLRGHCEGAESDKPDPKAEAQAAAVAKKHGFASLAQYDDVSMNISMIMSGIDPQTKKFTEPPEQIKSEIAALKADNSIPEAEKKEDLTQLEAELKNARPIQFKENIALVLKYFDQLAPIMQVRPAD
jgi:hypothetical protein